MRREEFTTRRHAILAGGAAIAGLLHCRGDSTAGNLGTAPDHLSQLANEPVDAIRPDAASSVWEPIGLLGVDGRILESITLIPAATEVAVGQDPKRFPSTLFPEFKQVRWEETDPRLMRFLSFALPSFPLCFAVPGDVQGGWGGSGMRLALLRMRTNQDTFWVSITRAGFAMGTEGADFTTIFFSGTLAMALGLIYKKCTGDLLPGLIEDALCGKRHIQQQLQAFEKWTSAQR